MFDPKELKKDFPILSKKINGKELIYLDNASTTQKPRQVIDALKDFYENHNANIHRGIYTLSEEATELYENARKKTANFINADSEKEIVFTRNTTESINLIAYTWGEQNIKEGDVIITSQLEHHSNLVPWQELAKRKKAKLKIIPMNQDFTLDLEKYNQLLSEKTKLVTISGMSNVTGTIPNLKKILQEAKKHNATTIVDGAQSTAHLPTDLQTLSPDFFAFSSHKMLGPTGVGILYGKLEILEKTHPFLFGGDMVKTVEQYETQFNELPYKFEAGTPNIADVAAFTKALEYLEKIGPQNIHNHEQTLLKYAKKVFSKYPEVKFYSPPKLEECGGILSFTVQNIHPHDIASIFNEEGIAIRSGHHCNMPLMTHLNIPATARMSFYLYNTLEDINRAETALIRTLKTFN